MSLKSKTGIISLFLIICIGLIASFIAGLHWQGTRMLWLINNSTINKLTCFGHNNIDETFQEDCYSPLKPEILANKNTYSCNILTNQQLDNTLLNQKEYNQITFIKADYLTFSLEIDPVKQLLLRSRETGEIASGPFKIVQNDDSIIQGIRKAHLNEFLGDTYEFITLSKKTGKGMRVWNNVDGTRENNDSIASFFFQCK